MNKYEYNLEDRLPDYAALIIQVTEKMNNSRAANHVAGQLLRSGTSPLFNHGEAEGAESPRDFAHKMSICLKELKESRRALRLIQRVPLTDEINITETALKESDELIRIFGAAIRTTRQRYAGEQRELYGEVSPTINESDTILEISVN